MLTLCNMNSHERLIQQAYVSGLVLSLVAAILLSAKAGWDESELNHNELAPAVQQLDPTTVAQLQEERDWLNSAAGVEAFMFTLGAFVLRYTNSGRGRDESSQPDEGSNEQTHPSPRVANPNRA